MKFKGTISKIDEGGVRAKTDNPLGEGPIRPSEDNSPAYSAATIRYVRDRKAWQEAEAQRKEYNVANEVIELGNSRLGIPPSKLEVGDRIEGDIINEEIVNVKIIQ